MTLPAASTVGSKYCLKLFAYWNVGGPQTQMHSASLWCPGEGKRRELLLQEVGCVFTATAFGRSFFTPPPNLAGTRENNKNGHIAQLWHALRSQCKNNQGRGGCGTLQLDSLIHRDPSQGQELGSISRPGLQPPRWRSLTHVFTQPSASHSTAFQVTRQSGISPVHAANLLG